VDNGLKILVQNQARADVGESEVKEKYILSTAIITYLQLYHHLYDLPLPKEEKKV